MAAAAAKIQTHQAPDGTTTRVIVTPADPKTRRIVEAWPNVRDLARELLRGLPYDAIMRNRETVAKLTRLIDQAEGIGA